jgi:hypothetical protein
MSKNATSGTRIRMMRYKTFLCMSSLKYFFICFFLSSRVNVMTRDLTFGMRFLTSARNDTSALLNVKTYYLDSEGVPSESRKSVMSR